MSICLVCDFSIVATCPSIQLPTLLFVRVLFVLLLLFVVVFLVNQSRNKGEGWSTTKRVQAPSNFIAGRPKAAPLFWFFGGFRCGVPLFIVMLVIYSYKIGKNRCLMLD